MNSSQEFYCGVSALLNQHEALVDRPMDWHSDNPANAAAGCLMLCTKISERQRAFVDTVDARSTLLEQYITRMEQQDTDETIIADTRQAAADSLQARKALLLQEACDKIVACATGQAKPCAAE